MFLMKDFWTLKNSFGDKFFIKPQKMLVMLFLCVNLFNNEYSFSNGVTDKNTRITNILISSECRKKLKKIKKHLAGAHVYEKL